MKIVLKILCFIIVLGIGNGMGQVWQPDSGLQRLTSWMVGSFSSQEQAEQDTNFYDIRLHMVQIWPERSDGVWLYVEQAAARALERPYRQRVYRLNRIDDSTLASTVYSFNNPLRYAGAWDQANALATLTPDSLQERNGCAILLKISGLDKFIGSTVGKNCTSELRGAAYATSKVIITATTLMSWDRGFAANGQQVWGAVSGGYIFKKLSASSELKEQIVR